MIHEYLQRLKDKRKLTNQQLADLSGVPISSVQRILAGQTDNPSYQSICDLTVALGGSMDELAGIKAASEEKVVENAAMYKLMEKTIADKDKWIMRLFIVCCIVVGVVFAITLIDILNGGIGFVRY